MLGEVPVLVVTKDEHLRDEVKEWVGLEGRVQWYSKPEMAYRDLPRKPAGTLVIWDAALDDTPKAVRHLHTIRPGAKVVVVSPSPNWKEARECFRAGATDYVSANMNTLKQMQFKKRLRRWIHSR